VNKTTSIEKAVGRISDGSSLLVGGFYGIGTPHSIIGEIMRHGKKNLTVISIEGGSPGYGLGKLIGSGCVSKLVVSWLGNNKNAIYKLISEGKLEMEVNPQGTLVERVRAGGYGLGGVLTPTGLGTYIEANNIGTRMTVNGKDWLYHTPIKADVCIVEAYQGDEFGNLIFRGSQMNINNTMCTAADFVIASVMCPICPVGGLVPTQVHTPGCFVDAVVQTENKQREAGE
jgi:acetate CoA/acetoacetate CoA-transferase alpha subunit